MTGLPEGSSPIGRADDPIERYLDHALVTLPGTPRQVRHALAEIEAHLLDAAADMRREGLDEMASRVAAVERFGPIEAALDRTPRSLRLTPALRRRLALGLLLVGAVGGLAIGAAGVVAAAVRAVWGAGAVATPFPPGSYTAADCARWQGLYPAARGCLAAMTADHADDFLRNAAGCLLLGILALAAYLPLRRRWAAPDVSVALPRASEEVAGALLALASAAVLLAQGVDAMMVTRGQGAGLSFSLGGSALVAGAYLAWRANARLRTPRNPASWVAGR
jgi:hypothetical protein